MRRWAAKDKSYPYVAHYLTDIGNERLAKIGALCITWNAVEEYVDRALGAALGLNADIFSDVVSRIGGFDGKIGILKRYIDLFWSERRFVAPMKDTLGNIEQYKKYRDAVAHVRIHDPEDKIFASFRNQGRTVEVLLTGDSLFALIVRVGLLQQEMVRVGLLVCSERQVHAQPEMSDQEKQQNATQVELGLVSRF